MGFAAQSWAMYDVFEDPERMRAVAVFSGHVLDAAVRVNEHTGAGFRWARIGTLPGELEIVADPALGSGEPVRGGVVLGTFWLSGRITTIHVDASEMQLRFQWD